MSAIRNKNQTAEEQLASFIVRTNYEDLPREATVISKSAILDLIGVAVAGSREPPGKILLEELRESGGQPQAGVIGGGFRTSVTSASLLNGTMAHALDYDDISDSWTGHPSAVLVPAILAMGERCHSSGKELLIAYVVGFEVGAKLGSEIGNPHYGRGWHITSTIGSIAGAAAAAKLLKLDLQKTQMALGIAASLAGGLRENFGTMTKPLHAGNAARNGNLAGLLASRGFTASEHWLTAASGFSKAFGADSHRMNEVLSQLGTTFSIISPGIWLKYYPACGGNHSPIEAALKLRQQYSLNPDDIVEVDCAVAPYLPQMLIHHHPKAGLEGKFSLEFAVSVALIDGEALLPQFTNERVNAPDIQAFMPKVKYHILSELGDVTDLNIPVTITITLKNGNKVSIIENNATGKPTNPMSSEQLRKKFETCTRILSPEERAEIVKLVSKLEKLDGIDRLMNLISGRVAGKSYDVEEVGSFHIGKRQVLMALGIPKSSYYRWRQGQPDSGNRKRPWNRITPEEEDKILAAARESPELSSRQLSACITDNEGFAVSESTVYRILRREGLVKRQEMQLTAANEYHTKTTRPHQMWATDASHFRVVGWGYYYLVTVMDDYSRFILAWKLQKDMSANSLIEVVQEAVDATGMTDVPVEDRTKLLSDNGAGYVSRAFRDYLRLVGIGHILSAPFHPQTNGKVERYQQSLKREVNQLSYELPSQLDKAIADFVDYYNYRNYRRYHKTLGNVTPADVLYSRREKILEYRKEVQIQTINRRREYNRGLRKLVNAD